MNGQTRRVVALAVGLTMAACGTDGPPIDEPAVEAHGGAADQTETLYVSVDETQIRTIFDADGATVTVPVETLTGAGTEGRRAPLRDGPQRADGLGELRVGHQEGGDLAPVQVAQELVDARVPEEWGVFFTAVSQPI